MFVIDRDAYHLKSVAPISALPLYEPWHFEPAGSAPRGPEVQQHYLAAICGEAHARVVQIEARKCRGGTVEHSVSRMADRPGQQKTENNACIANLPNEYAPAANVTAQHEILSPPNRRQSYWQDKVL